MAHTLNIGKLPLEAHMPRIPSPVHGSTSSGSIPQCQEASPGTHTHTHTCCNSLANTRTSYQWHSEACATPKPNTCVSSVCKRGLCLSGPRHHQFSYCQTQKLKNYCAHEINFQTSCARAHQTIYHVRSYAIRRSPRRWQFTGQGHTHARAHTHRMILYTRGGI